MLSTVERIFDVYYMVSVPKIATMELGPSLRDGRHLSGSSEVDNALIDQQATPCLSIADLAELNALKYDITFLEPDRVPEIHKAIQDHLGFLESANKGGNSLHRRKLPLEAIAKLNNLSMMLSEMYPNIIQTVRRVTVPNQSLREGLFEDIFGVQTPDLEHHDYSDLAGGK